MLNLFRQNTALSALATVVLALLLRIPLFLQYPELNVAGSGPLSVLLFKFIETTANPLKLSFIIATSLLVLQGLLINYIINRHDVLYKYTFTPGLVYILSSSLFPEQMQLSPQMLANTFLMLMLLRLFYLYESPKPMFLVLDAGAFLGLAVLFHIDMFLLLPYILASVIIFTSFNLRYIIIALLGILLPVYFIGTYFYLTDRLNQFILLFSETIDLFDIRVSINSYMPLLPLSILLIPVLFGYFGLSQNYFQNKVKTRRILQSVLLLAAFGFMLLLTESKMYTQALFFINIPFAVAAGYFFISTKRFWFKETLLWLLIISSVLFTTRIL